MILLTQKAFWDSLPEFVKAEFLGKENNICDYMMIWHNSDNINDDNIFLNVSGLNLQ